MEQRVLVANRSIEVGSERLGASTRNKPLLRSSYSCNSAVGSLPGRSKMNYTILSVRGEDALEVKSIYGGITIRDSDGNEISITNAMFAKIEEFQKEQSKIEYVWECNECGSQEYGMILSESDVHELGCGNCGSSEWHKAELK